MESSQTRGPAGLAQPRHRSWRTAARLVVLVALVGVLAALLAPTLLPSSVVRHGVAKALAARLGRPVTVEWARFSWQRGLDARGIRVAAGGAAAPGALLAKADRLVVRFHPLDAPAAAIGADVPIETVRLEGLEVWLAVDQADAWRAQGAGSGRPLEARTIQVIEGTFHVENRRLGRSVDLTHVGATVGQLATTGRGYVNLTAGLPGRPQGRLVVTASLSSLDFTQPERLSGSLKAEWDGVDWPGTLAAVVAEPCFVNCVGLTSGRLSATFGRGQWNVEGAIEANGLALGSPGGAGGAPAKTEGGPPVAPGAAAAEAEPPCAVAFDRAVLGFQMRRADPQKPIDLNLVRFSARGVNLQLSGTLQPDGPKGPEAALHMTGALDWAPLAESVALLRRVTERFEELGGGADLGVDITHGPEGIQVVGGADLAGTKANWPDVLRKEAGRPLRVDVDAKVSTDPAVPSVARVELAGEAGRLRADCRIPHAPAADDPAAKPAPTTVNLRAAVKDLESARSLYPVLNRLLGPIRTAGPLEVALDLTGQPPAAAADPVVWAFQVHADLTQAALSFGGASGKPVRAPFVVDGGGTVAPAASEVNLERLQVRLDQATLQWAGTGRVRWPDDARKALGGRFEGALDVRRIEAAGAVLAPDRFPADAPPLAGSAKLTVRADLADDRLTGTLGADLTQAAVRIPRYFDKPAGPPAVATWEGAWQMGDVHRLDGILRVTLPGGRLLVKGQSEVRLQASPEGQAPPPVLAAGEASALGPGGRRLTVGLAPEDSLQVHAEVADLERAIALSPLLVERLKGYRASGAAEGTLVLTMHPKTVRVGGSLDLTAASLDLAGAFVKPPDMPLRITLALDLLPPEDQDTVRLQLDNLEARLGESVARVAGRADLVPPASVAGVGSVAQALAMLSEAQLSVDARLDHGPPLRQAMPWLEPFYARCAVEGTTRLAVGFSGTAIRGNVHVDLDATACRFLEPGSLAKPAGTPATVTLDARYGDVPGELVLDRLEMKLADAEARASGRLLFDDPRLPTLVPPTAWSLHAEGRVPDVGRLASLFPAQVAAFKPAGGLAFDVRAAADPFGAGIEGLDLVATQARFEWLGRPVSLDGRLSYDGNRLATEGMHFVVGKSDVTLVAYVTDPYEAPTGSVLVRGKTLALEEVLDLLTQTHARLAPEAAAPKGSGAEAPALPPAAVRRLRGLLARAQVSVDIDLDRVTLTVPQWQTTYDLAGFGAEGRQSGNRFVVPRFRCALDEGEVTGQIVLDFRPAVPVLSFAFSAEDLRMSDNLRPFVDRTFPGMQVFGTVSTWQTLTQELAEGAIGVGHGETVLVDGLMVGPAAPDYVTALFPGLALSEYRFNKMSNVYRNLKNGDVENRMIFDGRAYDVYIFGTTHPEGRDVSRTDYTLGVDLSVSLGSKVWSRELDQGKIPLLTYTGRIVGNQYAEQNVSYVLPHQLAWDVFVRRNLVIQLIKSLGRKPPDLERPPVGPDETHAPGAAP